MTTTKQPKFVTKVFSAGAAVPLAIFFLSLVQPAPVWGQDGPEGSELAADGPPPDGPRGGGGHRGERFRKWIKENEGGEKGGAMPEEQGRMGRAGRFLGFVSEFNKQVQDPVQAVGLSAVGVKEYYRRQGKPEDAVPVLEEMLKTAKDQRVRNVLLFAMRQIYDEQKDAAKMLDLSKQIMRENIAAAEQPEK